ncbi:YqzK family protein [Lederbergia graminis]
MNNKRQAGHMMVKEEFIFNIHKTMPSKGMIIMKNIFKTFFKTFRILILFIGCTILFYYGIMWINQEYQNYKRYDEPEGKAVKAFQPIENEGNDWFSRLLLFYQNGE